MKAKNSAVMALEQKISDWQQEKEDAHRKLASYEQSVRHVKNIIECSEAVIAELRAAIVLLEDKR